MIRALVILLVFSCVACRQEKKSNALESPPARTRVVRAASPSKVSPSLPPPLLKTPRVIVSFTGSVMVHETINDIFQAEAVLADIRSLPPSAGRDNAIGQVISNFAKTDPVQARQLLERWTDGLISKWIETANKVALSLGKSDPEAAADFIEQSVPRSGQVGVWRWLLSELPPTARLPFLDRIPEGTEKLRVAANLLLVWLPEDPVACAAWLDDFAAGRTPEELRKLNNPNWYAAAPNKEAQPRLAAFRAAKTPKVRSLLANAAWKYARPDERASLIPELRNAIPDLEQREWESVIDTNPAGYATALTVEQIATISTKDMQKLIGRWAEKQPQAALDWAMEHQRPEAAAALSRLYYLEPKSAIAAAPKLPPGEDRDQAVSDLSHAMAHDGDVDAANALLPLITNPDFREIVRKGIESPRE